MCVVHISLWGGVNGLLAAGYLIQLGCKKKCTFFFFVKHNNTSDASSTVTVPNESRE